MPDPGESGRLQLMASVRGYFDTVSTPGHNVDVQRVLHNVFVAAHVEIPLPLPGQVLPEHTAVVTSYDRFHESDPRRRLPFTVSGNNLATAPAMAVLLGHIANASGASPSAQRILTRDVTAPALIEVARSSHRTGLVSDVFCVASVNDALGTAASRARGANDIDGERMIGQIYDCLVRTSDEFRDAPIKYTPYHPPHLIR